MDLLKLLKDALKDPFKIKSAFIIFVNAFFVLIIGLTIFSILNLLGFDLTPAGACDQQKTKKVESTVGNSNDITYNFNFSGNSSCFFYTFVTWDKPEDSINFWIYDPKGNVSVIEPVNKSTHNFIYTPSPLAKGNWKIVLKTSSAAIDYTGQISIR